MKIEDIIKGCQQYDKKSQFELVKKYSGFLKTICRIYVSNDATAKDILQESFMIIFSKIQHYKPIGSFEGWMRRITVNCALIWLRKEKLVKQNNFKISSKLIRSPKVYQDLNKEEIIKIIQELPELNRIVFSLFVLEGYTHKEISEMLKIKEVTSRTYLLRARQILQKKLLLKGIKLNEAI